jgi:hypothetical protein
LLFKYSHYHKIASPFHSFSDDLFVENYTQMVQNVLSDKESQGESSRSVSRPARGLTEKPVSRLDTECSDQVTEIATALFKQAREE